MPNPSNQIAVEDIKKVQDVIARENKQLVYAHFNLVVGVSIDADIQKCTNHLENSFGRLGIHISKEPTTNWNCLSTHSLVIATPPTQSMTDS